MPQKTKQKTLNLVGFRCWVRCPYVKGLCLIAKETEQGVLKP